MALRRATLFLLLTAVCLVAQRGLRSPATVALLNQGAVNCDSVDDSSLKAYWKLDEASGNGVDSKGANTLTDNGSVTSAAGKIGNARGFDSAAVRYFSRGDTADLSAGNVDITFGCWVFMSVLLNPGDTLGLVSKWAGAGNREYTLFLDGNANRYAFSVSDDGTAQTDLTATNAAAPELNAWHFMLAWHDATANTLNIQVDDGAITTMTGYASGLFDGTGDFTLGSIGTALILNGFLDESFVTKRILTPVERTALWQFGRGCRPSTL